MLLPIPDYPCFSIKKEGRPFIDSCFLPLPSFLFPSCENVPLPYIQSTLKFGYLVFFFYITPRRHCNLAPPRWAARIMSYEVGTAPASSSLSSSFFTVTPFCAARSRRGLTVALIAQSRLPESGAAATFGWASCCCNSRKVHSIGHQIWSATVVSGNSVSEEVILNLNEWPRNCANCVYFSSRG
ncbi:hypothetical protein WN66_00814 [Saccharomyces cerevisiae]|nr:hypothetical protein WN66_00814 [Saccharomyces cerevisiae]